MKKWIVIIAILVSLLAVVIIVSNNVNEESNIQNIDYILKISDFHIKDRASLKKPHEISVGNNIKELENGYYDFKINNVNDQIDIYLNKLWYEEHDKDYIQDEYLANICREIDKQLNTGEQEFEYFLYKYIKDNYAKVKEGIAVERISLNNIVLSFESYERNGKIDY